MGREGALCKAKSPAAWRASRRQWGVNAGWVHQGLLAPGSRRERAQTWGRRPGVVPGPPCAPRPPARHRPPPAPASALLPLLLLPGAVRLRGAGDRRAGGALRRPGSSAGPGRVGAVARRCEGRRGGRGGEPAGGRPEAGGSSGVSVKPHPSSGTRRAPSWPGGRGAEGRPWHPFRPLLHAVLPEPRGSPQVRPSRKEARRDLVPGRMCPKGKGPAGYFYQSLWVDAALFTVRKRCLANR